MENSIVGFAAVFGAMFAIANPFAALPLFLGYTAPLEKYRDKVFGAVITAVTLLVGGAVVVFAGKAVLNFFGVTIPGLRVGGGLVILLSGLAMMKMQLDGSGHSSKSLWQIVHDLVRRGHDPAKAAAAVYKSSPQAKLSMEKASKDLDDSAASAAIKHVVSQSGASQAKSATKTAEKSKTTDTASKTSGSTGSIMLLLMFPFAIPMILGPGFMSTIIIATEKNPVAVVLMALALNVALNFIVFLLAGPIRSILGVFGLNVLVRLIGLIIIALSFEIISAGLVDLLPGLAGSGR